MKRRWMSAIVSGALAVGLAVPICALGAPDDRQDDSSQNSRDDRDRSSSRDDSQSSSQGNSQQGSSQRNSSSKSGVRGFISLHDEDNDGYLSRSELPRDMREDFDSLDRNGDGYLSRSELQQHAQEAMRQEQASPVEVAYVWIIDANEGNMDLKDVQEAYSELQKIDRDNDGKITRNELRDRREHVVSRWCDKCFDRLDKDNDGELSKSEAKESSFADEFSKFDRNSDGYLTKSEVHREIQDEFESQSASRGSDSSSRR